mgnify:CR=1 FL=1
MKNKYGKIMPFLLVCFLVSTVVKAHAKKTQYKYKFEVVPILLFDTKDIRVSFVFKLISLPSIFLYWPKPDAYARNPTSSSSLILFSLL